MKSKKKQESNMPATNVGGYPGIVDLTKRRNVRRLKNDQTYLQTPQYILWNI
jgi:hypothetical protein